MDGVTAPTAPGRALALAPWVLAVLGMVSLVGYGIAQYPSMPAQLPTHVDAAGRADAWQDKSHAVVFGPLLIGIAIVAGLGVVAAVLPAIMKAPKDASEWAHFRTAVMRRALTGMLGFITAALVVLFAYISLSTWAARSETHNWPIAVFFLVVLASFWPLIRVNAWAERAAGAAGVRRTADDIADDARWTPSGLYHGYKGDPLFVPKPAGYGAGVTLNVGHPAAKYLLIGLAVLMALPLALMFLL